MNFKKLTTTNNWEYIRSYLDGVEIQPKDLDNKPCLIKWKDGVVTGETLCVIHSTRSYYDHSNIPTHVPNITLGIVIQHPYLPTKVELPAGIELYMEV